jgi:hypothetical protein
VARPVLQLLARHREFDVTPDEAVQAGMAPDPEWFVTEPATMREIMGVLLVAFLAGEDMAEAMASDPVRATTSRLTPQEAGGSAAPERR